MKLQDFPLITDGFESIIHDNWPAQMRPKLLTMIDVPDKWIEEFTRVETALAKVGQEKILQDLPLKEADWCEKCFYNDKAISLVFCGIDDSSSEIMKACGCTDEEIELVNNLLDEWFDGDERHTEMHDLWNSMNRIGA